MKILINILILTFFSFNISNAESEKNNPIVKNDNVEISIILKTAEVYPNPA